MMMSPQLKANVGFGFIATVVMVFILSHIHKALWVGICSYLYLIGLMIDIW